MQLLSPWSPRCWFLEFHRALAKGALPLLLALAKGALPLLALTGALPLLLILAKGALPLLLKQQMWERCILLLRGHPL